MLEKPLFDEELNSLYEEALGIDKEAEKLVESGESKSIQEATDLIIKTKESKEGIGRKVRIINILKFTEGKQSSDNFYSTQGLLFDDCVYGSISDYVNIEIVPFIKGEKDLIHNLTIKDFETLFLSEDSPRVFTLLISLAEKMKIPRDDIEKLYKIIEESAKRELFSSVVTGKTSGFRFVKELFEPPKFDGQERLIYIGDEIRKRMCEIAEKYSTSSESEDSECYRISIEAEADPEKTILDCIKQTPTYNAIKFISALIFYIKRNKDKVNKDAIMQAIQDLDDKKYGDKLEMVRAIERIFQ